MWLPIPTAEQVSEFQEILALDCGIELDTLQARKAATQLLQLFYVVQFAYQKIGSSEREVGLATKSIFAKSQRIPENNL